MKVFISWSGERSKLVASLLDDWITCVIQAVDPWMSSKDIDRGALWFTEISDQLANTNVGIICLTKENKNKPWILFESGALAKGLSSNRVCTFLVDLESTDLENPLAQFNHTLPNKTGLFQLVRTINLSLEVGSLKEQVLEKVFETYWPQFEEKFKEIVSSTPTVEVKDKRKQDDILIEVLSSVRAMDRRMRDIESVNNNKLANEDMISMTKNSIITRNRQITLLINQSLEKGIFKGDIIATLVNEFDLSQRYATEVVTMAIERNVKN